MLKLHNFWRSSASTRVRIALGLKGVAWEYVPHNLRTGAHMEKGYLALNPQGLVPALELENGTVIGQSLAIIEYLDETHPRPPLLPRDAFGRARVRSLAQMIACEIHPLNNTAVLKRLRESHGQDDEAVAGWYRNWVGRTFAAMEERLASEKPSGRFCHGDAVGLADICLAAQAMRNAQEGIGTKDYPVITRIFDACMEIDAFAGAAPDRQPDAV